MNRIRKEKRRFQILSGVAAIVMGTVLLAFSATASAQDYVGSEDCIDCHEENWNEWQVSGHPFKLMKSEQARYRPIPLPEGLTWDDVTYVIGGYKWKSRYLQDDGYIYTPSEGKNQYNYLTGEWSDYHAGEVKPYDCGRCHTTGWVQNPDPTDLSGNQDNLPGIHGTFFTGGVHCEECHGPGSFGDGMIIDTEAPDGVSFCGRCHIRGDADTIPASGGWIRHHEQYNEHLAGPHADALDCQDCHNPHKRGEFSIWKDGERREHSGIEGTDKVGAGAQCGVDCHSSKMDSFKLTSMYDYGVTCQDCHMPLATKSAQATGPHEGDVMTHILYIDTDPTANMFTDDGGFVKLDEEGKAAVTLDFACQRCHETASLEELAKFADGFHDTDKTLENFGLDPGLTGTWYQTDRAGEGWLLEVGTINGAKFMFASFYTYDALGSQVYLLAESTAIDGTMAEMVVYMTEGAMWGDGFNSDDVNRPLWGTATFTFPTCGGGTVELLANDEMKALGFSDMTTQLTRLLDSETACPTFVNNAE